MPNSRPNFDAKTRQIHSKRERAFRRASGKFYRLETPKARQSFYRLVAAVGKINVKSVKIIEKLFQIGSESFQNRPKTTPYQFKCVLGAFSAPNRAQVGSRTLRVICRVTLLAPFWSNGSPRGSILEVILEPFSFKNAIQNRYRNRTSKNHEKHEKSIEKTMRKTMKNPDIFHEKYACKICKCVVFPEQEIDFIKIENSKKFVFH